MSWASLARGSLGRGPRHLVHVGMLARAPAGRIVRVIEVVQTWGVRIARVEVVRTTRGQVPRKRVEQWYTLDELYRYDPGETT